MVVKDVLEYIGFIAGKGIPVMGHIGLTPQTISEYKVQGKTAQAALELLKQAKQLEEKGVFSLVLECVPIQVSRIITENI